MDKEYWQKIYNDNKIINDCSNFCLFIIKYFNENNINIKNVLDCGCGNGRDTYELSKYYHVDGIDNNGHIPKKKENCNFYNENFIT